MSSDELATREITGCCFVERHCFIIAIDADLVKVKELPGINLTSAAKYNRIYRVEGHDMLYYGPRTIQNIIKLNKLLYEKD